MSDPTPAERVLIVTGENSGDLHGAELARELLRLRPGLTLDAVGGDRMAAAGARLIEHIRRLSCAGVIEVIRKLPEVSAVFRHVLAHVRDQRPDAVVLIDFPDFNMRLARRLKQMNIPIVWYVSPQVWAWRRGRVKTLARLVDRMLVIFPFEAELYQGAGLDTRFVGHPLLDELRPAEYDRAALRRARGFSETDTILGLLPGSRRSEFERLFPPMQDTVRELRRELPALKVVASIADTLEEQWCRSFDDAGVEKHWQVGHAEEIMAMSDFCLVASGTATLQTALFETPMAIVYKVNPLTYWLLRPLVKLDHFSIVNILAGARVVPEFLQSDVNGHTLAETVKKYLQGPDRETMLADLRTVGERLGGPGASARAAQAVLELLPNE